MNRRHFLKNAGIGLMALPVSNTFATMNGAFSISPTVPLGLDAHSLRTSRWNPLQHIEYAGEKKLDSVLFNTIRSFPSLEEPYLLEVKQALLKNDLQIYFGVGSISKLSAGFRANFGTAEEQIAEGIRVAKFLGAKVITCRIGSLADRYTEGGIEAHMEEIIRVMKNTRGQILDAGIKLAVENHNDLRTDELITIIDETGTDICGAMLDPGNGVWQMDDPMQQLETIGPKVLCTSVRDYLLWESEVGATFQWMAIGQGMMDFDVYTRNMSRLCPGVPLHIETISNEHRPIPFLTEEFWDGYKNLKAKDLLPFMLLLRKGKPGKVVGPPPGMDEREFQIQSQFEELESSIAYLRDNYNVGLK
jgi:3-oxoisoapionate decarboxylase